MTKRGDHHSQPPVCTRLPPTCHLATSRLEPTATCDASRDVTQAVFLCVLRTCRKCTHLPPTPPSARPVTLCFPRACCRPRHASSLRHACRRLYFCAHQASAIPCFPAPIPNRSRVTNTLSSRAAKTVTRDKHFVVVVVVFSSLKNEQQHLTKSQLWRRVYTSPRGL